MLIKEIHNTLIERKKTLSLAESITGGALAYKFVRMSGCSFYLKGSVVAYSGQAKQEILGVNPLTIKSYGEVSLETAKEMAEGALKIFHSDYSLSVTGIAGPTGATDQKPVGLVAFGLAVKDHPTLAITHIFQGERGEIIEQSVAKAIFLLSEAIQ